MKRKRRNKTNVVIYQAKNGQIEFRGDFERNTIWGSINQIGELFGVQKAAVSKHMKNIFNDKELDKKATVSILETVQMEGTRKVSRRIEYYNLDMILSVGYRVNSKQATQFRIWATRTLRQHLLEGYTINRKRIAENHGKFLQAVSDVKALLLTGNAVKAQDVLELVEAFANTWFSLDAYDTQNFPKNGATKKEVTFTADELTQALHALKQELLVRKQATDLFGQERSKDTVRDRRQRVSILWQSRRVSDGRRKSLTPSLLHGEKPSFCGRQQTKRCICIRLVFAQSRAPAGDSHPRSSDGFDVVGGGE